MVDRMLRGVLAISATCLFSAVNCRSEDAPKPDDKPAAPKVAPAEPKDAKADANDLETTKMGTLSEKPAEAKAGTLAVLHVKAETKGKGKKGGGGAKKKKKGGMDAGPDETYFLSAKGETAERISDLLKRNATCQITGVIAPDGLSMNVSKVVESAAVADKKGKTDK